MKRVFKLIILIILSLSVYFIYQRTNNTNIKILTIGDGLSIGINSYGIKNYGYIDYYKDYLASEKKEVTIQTNYSKKDLMIKELVENIKTNPELKRDLSEAHQIILTIGYNDLIYKLNLEENLNHGSFQKILEEIKTSYMELITEIRKYNKNEIVVIGYYRSNKSDYYLNIGIRKLNEVLKSNESIFYIDTYELLENKEKYFSNPNSYYPNQEGYQKIAQEIISKNT